MMNNPTCKACAAPLDTLNSLGVKDGYALLRCKSCQTVTVDPWPTVEQLVAFYQSYEGTTDYKKKKDRKIARAKRRLKRLMRQTEGRSFLDVGCNYGFTVEAARDLGLVAYGIDIDATAVNASKEMFGQKYYETISVQDYAARGGRECGSKPNAARETNLRIGNKNLSVARAKWNVGAESTAGAIVTYGDPNSPGSGSTVGLDFRLRSSHARGNQIAELIGWAQHTNVSGKAREFRALVPDPGFGTRFDDFDSRSDQAYGLRFRYPNDVWFVDASWTRVGDDFTPTLGFVNRTGIDQFHAFSRRRWRPAASYVRNYDSLLELDYVRGLDGRMQTLIVNPTFLEIHNALDDFVYLGAESRSEVISDVDEGVFGECRGFYINETPLICIPAKRFDWRRVQLGFGMAQSRPVALFLDYSYGGFFGGKLHSIDASAELRLNKHFFGQIDYIENRASGVSNELCTLAGPPCLVDQQDFVQRLVRLRAQFIFTPDLSWDTFVQYDNLSGGVGWNSRLRWILQPGNELVIIWNQAHGTNDVEGRDFRFQSAGLTSKLSWTFRF